MQLNEEQTQAVEHPIGSPACLIAGAGSGKTRVMTERVKWLITQGVIPRKICALTFTNKAAGELAHRLGITPETQRDLVPRITTIHALALAAIRRNPKGFGLKDHLSLLDDYDQGILMRKIIEREIKESEREDYNPWNIVEKIAFHRARGLGFSREYTPDIHQQTIHMHKGFHALDADVVNLWKAYESEKNANSVIDFDDMLCLVNRRVREDQPWAEKWSKMFEHVLMDEGQDTNPVQWELVNSLLASDNLNLCVVGDISQSIFGFNGAAPEILKAYSEGWRGVVPKLYRLAQNYRSVPEIVGLANAVQQKMVMTIPLKMLSARGELGHTGTTSLMKGGEDDGTPREIANRIASQIYRDRQTTPYKENAILVRSGKSQVRDIESELVRLRIPYVVRGGQGLLQTEEVRDVLAYLRLAVNPKDFMALNRAIAAPKRGLGTVALEKIRDVANKQFAGDLLSGCWEVNKGKAGAFVNTIREIQKKHDDPVNAFDFAIKLSGYSNYLRDKYKKDVEKLTIKLENLERLALLVVGLLETNIMNLADVVFQLSMDEQAKDEDKDGRVVISTIHKCIDPSTLVGVEGRGLITLGEVANQLPIKVATLRTSAIATNRFDHPTQPCLKVTTHYGYELIGADNHHILTSDLESYVPLNSLHEGDVVPIRLGVDCGDQIEPSPREIAIAEMLGLLVGDGSYNDSDDYTVQFASGDADVFGYFCGLIRSVFGLKFSVSQFSETNQQGYICNKQLRMELMEWGLGYAKLAHKVVPSKVFTSHTKVQSAFLRGLFESDGGSGPSSPGIYFTNTSRSVCQGAHLLLTNLGILTLFALETPAKDNNSDTYTLFGAGVEVHHFENKVGFIGHRKISNLKRLTKRAKGKTNVDFLPHTVAKQLAVEAYRLIKARGLSAYKLNKMNEQRLSNSVTSGCYNKHGLSVGHAKELLLGLERLFGIDSEFSTVIAALHKLTGHRVFFDHVAKVERVEDRSLLDIEVPETESYWTNGFISHNSKGLEWQTVFISSVYEGSMPHMYSMGNDTEIEEERRLFYVALTRAKDRLVICVPTYLLKKTSTGWNKISVEPSRFLAEIGIV